VQQPKVGNTYFQNKTRWQRNHSDKNQVAGHPMDTIKPVETVLKTSKANNILATKYVSYYAKHINEFLWLEQKSVSI